MREAQMKKDIVEYMNKLPFVRWDRFVFNNEKDMKGGVTVYGWIKREDEHADYVELWITSKSFEFMTSSAEYSDQIYKIFNEGKSDGHQKCKRVEDFFDVYNSIKLTKPTGFKTHATIAA